MNGESIFISLHPKIRKQLELQQDKKLLTYYEALNLTRNFTPDELEHFLNRALELLSHLRFHPQFRDEAASASQKIAHVAETLRNPGLRSQYDIKLRQYEEDILSRIMEHFRQLVDATAKGGGLTTSQKDVLLSYASTRDISQENARHVIDSRQSIQEPAAFILASPPRLTAPLPRYLETEAFQILLKKSTPILEQLNTFRCGRCNATVPVTHLACPCGALMRGKLFCPDCGSLFSHISPQCPFCAKESNIMVELSEEDVPNVYKYIETLISREELPSALATCKDLLTIRPSDQHVKTLRENAEDLTSKKNVQTYSTDLQQEALKAREKGQYYLAYQKFLLSSSYAPLPDSAIQNLKDIVITLEKKAQRLSRAFLLSGIIMLLLAAIVMFLNLFNNVIYLYIILCAGFACLVGTGVMLFNKRKYRKRFETIAGKAKQNIQDTSSKST
jgi:hypothetical protein